MWVLQVIIEIDIIDLYIIESAKEYDQEESLHKTPISSASQVKPLFANVYEMESIDNTNNTTPRSVSSTDEQNTASTTYTTPRSVSSTDEQNTASTTSINCIDFNNLVPMFTAFVQAIKSGTLLPNTGNTSFMHPQPIMSSYNTTTSSMINDNTLSTNQVHNNTSSNNVSVLNIKTFYLLNIK